MGDLYWPSVCGNKSVYDAFWSPSLSISTQVPDLSRCFQDTVLVWIPCGIFILTAIVYFWRLSIKPTVNKTFSKLNTTKVVLCSLLCVVVFLDLLKSFGELSVGRPPPLSLYLKPAIYLITFIMCTLMVLYEYKKGIASGGPLFCLWLALTVLGIIPFRSLIITYDSQTDPFIDYIFRFCTFYVYYVMILVLFVIHFWADKDAIGDGTGQNEEKTPLLADEVKERLNDKPPCPELSQPFWSRVLFLWITKMIIQGYRNALTFADLWNLLPEDTCDEIIPKYEQEWKTEVLKNNFSVTKKETESDFHTKKMDTLPEAEFHPPRNAKKKKVPTATLR